MQRISKFHILFACLLPFPLRLLDSGVAHDLREHRAL